MQLEPGLPDVKICICFQDPSKNCGWLLVEVTKRYAMLVEQYKAEYKKHGASIGLKIKKKIIAALKSVN